MFEGPFRGSAAIAAGKLTRGALRGARFRRLFPDVYVAAGVEVDLAIRSRAAYLFAAGRGVAGGYSAAELLGAGCAPPDAVPEVVVGHHVRPQPGLVVHRRRLAPCDVWTIGDCRVTSPLRTAWDLTRGDDLVEAVVAIDALGAWGAFAPADLLAYRDQHPAARGGPHLERAVALADPAAGSPLRTRLRLLLVLAGLPCPEVGHRLRTGRGPVRFDLAYPEARLALCVDEDEGGARRDVGTPGWHTLRFSATDVQATPRRTVETVARSRVQRLPHTRVSRAS